MMGTLSPGPTPALMTEAQTASLDETSDSECAENEPLLNHEADPGQEPPCPTMGAMPDTNCTVNIPDTGDTPGHFAECPDKSTVPEQVGDTFTSPSVPKYLESVLPTDLAKTDHVITGDGNFEHCKRSPEMIFPEKPAGPERRAKSNRSVTVLAGPQGDDEAGTLVESVSTPLIPPSGQDVGDVRRPPLDVHLNDQMSRISSPQHKPKYITRNKVLPRSHANSAAVPDESEYAQYWRGEVTVIKMTDSDELDIPVQSAGTPTTLTTPYVSLDKFMANSPITGAIIKGDNTLVLESLRQGERATLICSKTGKSYLHIVSSSALPEHESKYVPMVYQLSNTGIDLNVRDNSGFTALRLAITRRLPQLLAALLKCGADFTEEDEYQAQQVRGVAKSEMLELIRRLTPSYWSAVHDPTPFKVHRLVKSWSRVNLSRNNITLIEYAKQNVKDESIAKLLVQHEASIELAHAVMAGDCDRTKALLCDSSVDINTRDSSVKNNCFEPFAPLSLVGAAIKFDHADVLKVLRDTERKKSVQKPRSPISDSTAGGDRSATVRKGRGYGIPATTVFHYSSANGGTCELNTPSVVTSALCVLL
ncbi:unnamed protein product [Lymnaea stagnalis]|uniref:Uncharacterized protein n=1 Tax=Lymnaea stagnalis TaxID=6523 RepID=A0AAV2I8H6_LYMST